MLRNLLFYGSVKSAPVSWCNGVDVNSKSFGSGWNQRIRSFHQLLFYILVLKNNLQILHAIISSYELCSLCEKCPYSEFSMVNIFPHSDWIRREGSSYFQWLKRGNFRRKKENNNNDVSNFFIEKLVKLEFFHKDDFNEKLRQNTDVRFQKCASLLSAVITKRLNHHSTKLCIILLCRTKCF